MDLLAAGRSIVQRLQDLDGIRRVGDARDLDEIFLGQVQAPAIYVVFDGGQRAGEKTPGSAVLDVRWVISLATLRHTRPQTGDRDTAGPLLGAIHSRLTSGWRPESAMAGMALLDMPRPAYLEKINLYALRYVCRVVAN